MDKKINYILIGCGALGVVIILVGSFLLYQYNPESMVPISNVINLPSDIVKEDKTEDVNAINETTTQSIFRQLTDDERLVLNPPPTDAPEVTKNEYFNLIEKVAIDESTLAIGSNCQVSPVVLRISKQNKLIIKNYDSIAHTIAMHAHNLSFLIPAQDSLVVDTNFGEHLGSYGYICDQSPLAGFILVTE